MGGSGETRYGRRGVVYHRGSTCGCGCSRRGKEWSLGARKNSFGGRFNCGLGRRRALRRKCMQHVMTVVCRKYVGGENIQYQEGGVPSVSCGMV